MLRAARMLRCATAAMGSGRAGVGISASSLDKAITEVESVWNVTFQQEPTTKELRMHAGPRKAEPMFHVLSLEGNVVENEQHDPHMDKETAVKIMTTMVRQNAIDKILLEAQRQGRIPFYMTCFGEEAAITGAAAGLSQSDQVFLQYREVALIMYRGYTIPEMVSQCMGNIEHKMKGRQMPMHVGSKELNVHMVSSPLATQIPHASGAGYALRLENDRIDAAGGSPDAKRICACFFGEGAASEGDFHAGVNFASTVGSHTLFFVRNNGFAISTPTADQYNGDGIFAHGLAYGIPAIRVDGNDALAVCKAVKVARELILREGRPALVEAMSYRVSHHSTSDDSGAYRSKDEISHFIETFDPIARFSNYLVGKGWWTVEQTEELSKSTRKEVLKELKRQEKLPLWPVETLLDDVYQELPPDLVAQKAELLRHYNKYKAIYDAEKL